MQKIIDLTLTIREGMTTFPVHWHPFVEITQLGRLGIEQRETRKIVLGTHTGTHMDAPRHFVSSGATIDKLNCDLFIGKAYVVDLSYLPEKHEVSLAEIAEKLNSVDNDRIILKYNWSKNIDTNIYYSHHPFLSTEAAEFLVKQGVCLVAMDTPMPDNPKHGKGCDIDSPIHHILLGNNIPLVEYLTNLEQVSEGECEFIVLPLKIESGDGAPVRCIAIV